MNFRKLLYKSTILKKNYSIIVLTISKKSILKVGEIFFNADNKIIKNL